MSRVFLRFYLGVVATFVVTATLLLGAFLGENKEDAAVVEHALRGGVRLAAARLQGTTGDTRAQVLAELRATFDYELTLLPPEDPSLPDRVAGSTDGVYYASAEGQYLVAPIPGEGLHVRFGPLPEFPIPSPATLLTTLLIVAVLWGAATLLLLRPMLRATRALEHAAEAMVAGDWSARVDDHGSHTGDLARSFNRMADKTL